MKIQSSFTQKDESIAIYFSGYQNSDELQMLLSDLNEYSPLLLTILNLSVERLRHPEITSFEDFQEILKLHFKALDYFYLASETAQRAEEIISEQTQSNQGE
ncbi:hypothetical protein [Cochlodiniinecator piscidefendens]|uniref:hypothetical protein n=1 Tax=Cochlodiniinecator piscidefendens TaxID=2715756 RepID=UPI00140BE2B6|nr:hypothetical protein [Cochlodiniinecator piscidefendens]